jgi:hypothetical protein
MQKVAGFLAMAAVADELTAPAKHQVVDTTSYPSTLTKRERQKRKKRNRIQNKSRQINQ